MASSSSPAEVGTRGTIGSLVSQEIEYFRRIQTDHKKKSTASSSMNWVSKKEKEKKKKKMMMKMVAEGSSSGFLPSFCSVIELQSSKLEHGSSFQEIRALVFGHH
ncbi:hypothetical protein AXF42_Ash020302 [Apostasia shenzhenica]|uniref:Uncharacterized protein n=1 Tax=Apostasia shenzhenica TaxID=1088818 RepID=A0A2H9ZSY9_9ASPA|nr:hypothetical protein AXF42_Ash020302 [Apostasia shenzhenica]